MCAPDIPDPPSPRDTSQAQTGTSVSTAIANAYLGNVDHVGPDGTTKYNQSGSFTWTDPYTKQTYTVPRFTQTVTMSPEAQAIYDKQQAAKGNLADLASQQSGFLKDYMAQPIDLNNEATEARLMELGRKRLDPVFQQRQDALATRLANQGIGAGSEAYNREMQRFGQQENDAYNQLLLQGRGQAVQEALTERNQPINEITALLSGSQVSQPSFTNTQQPQIPTTDNAGLINANYDQQVNKAMAEYQANQGILGGLFGLGGKIIGLSDRDEKTDIERVGRDPETGLDLYAYRYKGDPKTYPKVVGPMAQDVEKTMPDAVSKIGGKRVVDFGMLVGA